MASEQGWQRLYIDTPQFILTSYLSDQTRSEENATERRLTVYIEGDGLAWASRSRISSDPTPTNPIGLRLALQQSEGRAAYLARPCQFTEEKKSKNCENRFWTSARFSQEVINASDKSITTLMERTSSSRLRLVGYSGGGAVAALVASRRNDVDQLITVAGNLDHVIWTTHHRISPLRESLNPANAWEALLKTPQLHLIGDEDRVVSEHVLDSYLDKFPDNIRPRKIVFPGYTHQCCWVEDWPQILYSIEKSQP